MKLSLTILFTLLIASGLSGCNTLQTNKIASAASAACEQGIEGLNQRLNADTQAIDQTNISRANSLLLAAKIQRQFAKYPGCVEKVNRAQDYLSGRETAIISRLTI